MKISSNGKKILALTCALCMVAGTIRLSGLKKVDASAVPESMDTSLTPITFRDFNISDGTYSTQKWGTYQTADTLDGMVFQGYVTFPKRVSGSGERIYLGGNSSYNKYGTSGISLRNVAGSDSALMVLFEKKEDTTVNPDGNTGTYYIESRTAGTTLINHEFYLQVSIQAVDKDSDGAKDDVKVGLWFNGVLFNNEYLYFSDCAQYLGNMMQVYALSADQPVTVSSRVIQKAEAIEDEEQETGTIPITFSDFGVAAGSYNNDGNGDATKYTSGGIGTYKAADTLNGTVFNGKVTFPERTTTGGNAWINIGGLASIDEWGNTGLRIQNIAGNNYAWGLAFYRTSTDKTATQYIDLSIAEDKITLNGAEVQLQLTFEITDSDIKLGVRINDAYSQTFYFADCAGYLGNKIQVWAQDGSATQVASVAAPVSLPEVTYGEIGIADGFYGATNSSEKGTGNFAELTPSSLDGKVFKGTVTFPERTSVTGQAWVQIGGRYSDDPNGGTGIRIYNISTGNSAWGISFQKPDKTATTTQWLDLSNKSVVLSGAEVQLQLAFEIVDSDDDGSKDDVKLSVLINDTYSQTFNFADCAGYLGNMIQVYAVSGSNFTVASSELSKADGTEITFADFGIADGNYNVDGSNDATKYTEGGIGEYKVTRVNM